MTARELMADLQADTDSLTDADIAERIRMTFYSVADARHLGRGATCDERITCANCGGVEVAHGMGNRCESVDRTQEPYRGVEDESGKGWGFGGPPRKRDR